MPVRLNIPTEVIWDPILDNTKPHFLTSDCFDESRFATNVKNSNMLVVISAKVLVLVDSSCPTTSVPEELSNSSFVSIFTTFHSFETRTNF